MARCKDPVVAEVKRIRRRISLEMAKAIKEGRYDEYIREQKRVADEVMRNGARVRAARVKAKHK